MICLDRKGRGCFGGEVVLVDAVEAREKWMI